MGDWVAKAMPKECGSTMRAIDFISYKEKAIEQVLAHIQLNLPIIKSTETLGKEYGKHLILVAYADLKNWKVEEQIKRLEGRSAALEALADKLGHMTRKGTNPNIMPMLFAIGRGSIKKLTKPAPYTSRFAREDGEHLGYGHFRWNNQAYTLTPEEVARVREYFQIDLDECLQQGNKDFLELTMKWTKHLNS